MIGIQIICFPLDLLCCNWYFQAAERENFTSSSLVKPVEADMRSYLADYITFS